MEKYFLRNKSGVLVRGNQPASRLKSKIHSLNSLTSLPVREIHSDELTHLKEYHSKDLRLFSKTTLLALECLYDLSLKTVLENYNSDRVGLYVTGPWGSLPHNVINAVIEEGLSPSDAMRKHFPPKFNLKNLLGILPGHLSIHFNIQGPTNSFPSFEGQAVGISHAIEKAKLDLECEYVDLAVIVGVNSYEEETMAFMQQKNLSPQATLIESACALLLTKDSEFNLKNNDLPGQDFYGGLTPLFSLWGSHVG